MRKIECIWREILYQAIEEKNPAFSITHLSKKFLLSTSVVSYALYPLRKLGIVEIGKNHSNLLDVERLLYFWATKRNLASDIIYQTNSSLSVTEREAFMPSTVFPTAYSFCRLFMEDAPADYDTVYFYAQDTNEIVKRFPENTRQFSNIFILKADSFLMHYVKTPLAQVFVDLWNLPEWYAKEYSHDLFNIIKEKAKL